MKLSQRIVNNGRYVACLATNCQAATYAVAYVRWLAKHVRYDAVSGKNMLKHLA